MASPSRAHPAACLGDDTVAAVLEGALSDEAARRAREHLGSCDACRRLVSAVVADGASATRTAGPSSLDRTVFETVVPGALVGGKYRVERLVGAGGMGRVFAARQLDLDRPVALKVLRPDLTRDPLAIARFAREARLASGLMSDSAVRIHELGQLASGEPYLVMELLAGEDLGAIVARGPVPVERAVAWVSAACEAIGEAHALGIIHRDLKPQNLFLAHGPGGERLKVLDFGLAKLAVGEPGQAALTADGLALGSPRYMAPEQIAGSAFIDARCDVWALGATLHHLLAGAPPFDGGNLHELVTSVRDRAAPSLLALRPAVGERIASIVQRCLAKDPAARYANAKELAAALGAQLGAGGHGIVYRAIQQPLGRDVAAPYARPPAPPRSGAGLVVALVVGLFAIVAIVVVGGAFFAFRSVAPLAAGGAGPSGEANGVLTNVDEARLRTRLARRGLAVGDVTRQDFGTGCSFVILGVTKGKQGGFHVSVFDCASRGLAANEAARLRKFPSSWTIAEGTRVLNCALEDEVASRELCEGLVDPAPDAGRR